MELVEKDLEEKVLEFEEFFVVIDEWEDDDKVLMWLWFFVLG